MRFIERINESWRALDRRSRLWGGYLLIAVLAAAVAWSALSARVAALEKKRAARETVLKELLPLKVSYTTARQSSDRLLGQMATVRQDDTPARIIEEIGIRGRSLKITPAKGDDRSGYVEDAADVRIEGLSMNEAINLLFRIEKGGRPIVLKKGSLRVRFDDPARCDLAMTMALLRPLPVQAR